MHTGIISANGGFHDSLHPFTNSTLLIGTEIMCLVIVVIDPKTIFSRIQILVNGDLVANDIDVALDLGFLWVAQGFRC